MFIVTDKLDKSDLKYDILEDEKQDLTKEEKIVYVPVQHHASRLVYIILIGLTMTAAAWLMFATTNYSFKSHKLNTQLLSSTNRALNETEIILSKVQDSVNLIRDYNVQSALQYVDAIKEMLQERTRYAVQQINRIVTDKIREIDNELTSFDYVITEASGGIVDYTLQDMKSLRESLTSVTNETYRTDLENIVNKAEEKVASAFADLDSMYTFYGSYMGDIIDHKVQNATDRISMIINSNRRQCECTIKEKVNFCYNISTQNVKMSQQLESLVKVFGIINNTTDILDTLEPVMLKDSDTNTCSLISEARLTLNKALEKSESLLESLLKDDDCYLGSAVRKAAYKTHGPVKEFIKNSFETSIWNLSDSLKITTANFKVVQEKHRQAVEEDITKSLDALSQEILLKAKSLGPVAYDEYLGKSSFSDVKSWMDTKFQNVTDVINPMFTKRQADIAEALKYNLQYVVFQQLPFISSLSVQNYLPTDVCPVSTDYQKFVSVTLDGYLDPTKGNTQQELAMTTDFAKESETAQLVQDDMESNQNQLTEVKTDTGDETDNEILEEVKQIISKYAAENGIPESELPTVEIMVTEIPIDEVPAENAEQRN